MSKSTSGLGSLKSRLNAKGRIKRKGTGKGGGKGTAKGSGKRTRKSGGKGASYAARMKRLEVKQSKAPKVVTDIRVIGSIFDDALINPTQGDGADDHDIGDEGVFDLDFTKSENKDGDENELEFDEVVDLDNLDDQDFDDLHAADDDLDDVAPHLQAHPRGKKPAFHRLKGKVLRDSKKAKRGKVQEDYIALPTCRTMAKIDAWVTEGFDVLQTKCHRAIDRKKALDPYRTALNAIVAGEVFTSMPMINMRVVSELLRQHLYAGMLRAAEADGSGRLYLVTVIPGQGLTSHFKTDIDLCRTQAREQAFLRDLSPDYFAVNELALFNSNGHPDGGQMLQRHIHAVVWWRADAPDPQVGAAKHLKHFEANFTAIPVIDVRLVDPEPINLARVAAYLAKAPSRCKSWRPAKEGKRGFINNSEAGDRPTRYLRMAQIRSMLSLEDATFAGGLGAEIRSGLIKTARAQCAAEAPPAARLLHPDAIGSFWVDVMRALNRKSWNLPVIRTRK